MGTLREIVVDCEHAATLARFWAAAIDGYAVREYAEAEVSRLAARGLTPETDPVVLVEGPGPLLCFQQVDGLANERGRVHLDLFAADRAREIERLRALGASVQREEERYTVMRDPEGNRFCVVDRW